jgi:hypothetical protein
LFRRHSGTDFGQGNDFFDKRRLLLSQVTPGATADTVTVTIPREATQQLFARLKVVATP